LSRRLNLHIVKEQDREEDMLRARKLLADRLEFYARNKGYRFDDLANGTGLSRSYLSRVFNGQRTPSIETLYKLSKVLGFEVIDLVTETEYWVLSKGFKSKGGDIDLDKYHALIEKKIDLLEFNDRIFRFGILC